MNRHTEKSEAREIVVKNKLLVWLDNYWYHYKWPTIVVAFFLFVGIVCFAQCSSKETGDLTVAYAGNYVMTAEERQRVLDVFNTVTPIGEDGKPLSTMLSTYTVYTDEEMRKLNTDEDGEFSVFGYENIKHASNENLQIFQKYLQTGESAIWFVSEYVYGNCKESFSHIARPLTDLYETPPASAYDGYAIRLSQTDLYKTYDVLKVLPEDTLVVFSKSFYMGETSNQETYAQFEAMFRGIVDFQAK